MEPARLLVTIKTKEDNFSKTIVKKKSNDGHCICYAPNGTVICKSCGYTMNGRVRKPCSQHPTTIFLMDVEQCPQCKAFSHMLIQVQDINKNVMSLG